MWCLANVQCHWPIATDRAGCTVQEPCETGGRHDRAHASSQETVPWALGGEPSWERQLSGRDRSPEVPECLTGIGLLSVAVRDEVPLDKRDVSYYSFHISTQGSPLAVLLPQGKGRVGQ
jgi:hypothetical protein